ncbi:hypothetical protein PRZ48_010327 [Zasmidium cellare]|uniref:CmcJ-like methyltransferase n=1 Tax=Zasmidium cellare TaxID=395010 RepID=A0ABR0E8B7_ZASCE|nr:hypothetical protein PRZ48_010327 [Zasmidium cellare]
MAKMHLVAPISYLGTVPEDEKPYHMMYGDFEGLPRTNISREWQDTVFEDVRGCLPELSFNDTGFAVHPLHSKMAYEDFDDEHKVRSVYFSELEARVKELLGAHEVKFFRYGIRKRHSEFPVSTGQEYDFAQPTSIAHVDATLDSTRQEMTKQFGDRADELMSRRFQWINVWKPLRGPVNDWPLCLCDASTLSSSDAHATDMVYPDYFTENQSIRFNPSQRWYFLSDHSPDEIIIFKQSDSDPDAVHGVPHCSFENPATSVTELPRESIEARALVVY